MSVVCDFYVQCDGSLSTSCHTEIDGESATPEDAIAYALEMGWVADGDKHYCPSCAIDLGKKESQ